MMRWIGLLCCTALLTVGVERLNVPSAPLFAGLLMAAVLAIAGLAPRGRDATDDRPARPPLPRNLGLFAQGILGVYIGTMVRSDTLSSLGSSWLPVVVVGFGTLLLSVIAGALLGLHRRVDPLTGSLALVAGGASGLVALTRELGGEERLVAVVQYVRVALITATIPLVASLVFHTHSASSTTTHATGDQRWGLLLVVVCVGAGLPLGRLIHLPAAGLLGPLILSVAGEQLHLTSGAAVPTVLVTVAYALIGWQAGLGFTMQSLKAIGAVLPHALGLIVGISAGSAGLGVLLSLWTGESMFDGYLATTPGGIYAVLAAAAASGSNITFVVGAQIIRVLLMLFIAPFAARGYHRWISTHRRRSTEDRRVGV
ncbi:AbrB family transcriptional regulator [Williamsia sterculiae]|uniref:AbrB family transcriptional regulator n=1 Tax=Williamsia sterculiae TaxID=1344003 RepID=UPI0009712FFA